MSARKVTLATTVYRVERIKSSSNGNPAYKFHTEHGQFRTVIDTQAAYRVTNDFRVDSSINDGNGVQVTLTMTPAQRVYDWTL